MPVFTFNVSDAPGPSSYGFPMSQFLRDRECGLGRNARMLAAQALARIEEERKVNNCPIMLSPESYQAVLNAASKNGLNLFVV